ncbi:hypothetical protein P3T37_001946 [Kitasatospora sp. MAA4]|uniref:hypothetical protein n=1 Tax=Kitasatospora sp. MAA4 TaxID=3035093 RepID=UPI002476B978|nr:hypothetical protein [Kitasatospora sp. MAA4]MDH6132561.1 hypothetical protein [Kitasatospora sp. MAA4]
MACLQRAVLLRAAAAVLVLGAAFGGEHVVGAALARRGAEQAARQAYPRSGEDQLQAAARAARSGGRGHRAPLPGSGGVTAEPVVNTGK